MLLNFLLDKISGRCLQFLCAIIMSLAMVVYGFATSWPSLTLPVLMSENTPLPSGPISENEVTWINSVLFGGGIIGAPIIGFISTKCGRKLLIIASGLILLTSWILITLATDVTYLITSRFLCGFACASIRTLVPAFYSEISEKKIRGNLGSISGISFTVGVVLGSIACDSLSFYDVSYVPIVFLGFFMIVIVFPDTPESLLLQKRDAEAEKSLKFYRKLTPNDEIMEEFLHIKSARDDSGESFKVKDFKSPEIIKITLLCIVIRSFTHCSGLLPLGANSIIILNQTNTSYNMNRVTTNFYIVQLVSILCSGFMLDRLGRRLTLVLTLALNVIFLILFGAYYHLLALGVSIPQEYEWILVFSFYGISGSGVFSIHVPGVITSEICPMKLRTVVGSIVMTLQWLIGFAILQSFLPVCDTYGTHALLYFFAIWTTFVMIYVYFLMPETNGRTTEDIVETFKEKTIHCSIWKAKMTIKKV